jgi:hypothetical protein
MTQTQTGLFNLASQLVGGRGRLESTVQASRYNDVFNQWYDVVRDTVFAATQWQNLKEQERLNLISSKTASAWNPTQPMPGYTYAFRLPKDFLRARELVTGARFELGNWQKAPALFADELAPILIYTKKSTPIDLWESELYMCVAYALAAYCCNTLTGKRQLTSDLFQISNQLIETNRNNAANSDDDERSQIASWHQARGLYRAENLTRYTFPNGAMFNTGTLSNV